MDGVSLLFLNQKTQLRHPKTWTDWSQVQDQSSGCKIKLTKSGAAKGQNGNKAFYLDSTINSK